MSRRLGQHFLINKAAIKKIIAALDLKNNDTTIEIGPGKGALTLPLAEQCQEVGCKIIGIEKDPVLARNLELGIRNYGETIAILRGDALKIVPPIIHNSLFIIRSWKLVGNIPYYITGKLLRVLGELEHKPELIVLTIQKEVAERICAHAPKINPAHRKCPMCGINLLAAATQFWAESKIIGYLKPTDFSPPPKVNSAIIKLATKILPLATREDAEKYYKLIKIIFKQPRKTLLNNLSVGLKLNKDKVAELMGKSGLKGDERPQNLNIEMILKLLENLSPKTFSN